MALRGFTAVGWATYRANVTRRQRNRLRFTVLVLHVKRRQKINAD
jgi:hypothetical protein